jgi:uncharacterized membrane-anchored protein YhcB (DUF1043 family)
MNIKDRISAALARLQTGNTLFSTPPHKTDVDIVLTDCQTEIANLTVQLAHANAAADLFQTQRDKFQGLYNELASQANKQIAQQGEIERIDAQDYADDYVFRGDSDYYPNEVERMLIQDALLGFECELQPFIEALKAAQLWQPIGPAAPTKGGA